MVDHRKETTHKFAPFQSAVEEGFLHSLSSLKLNELWLDESPIPITGKPSVTLDLDLHAKKSSLIFAFYSPLFKSYNLLEGILHLDIF